MNERADCAKVGGRRKGSTGNRHAYVRPRSEACARVSWDQPCMLRCHFTDRGWFWDVGFSSHLPLYPC